MKVEGSNEAVLIESNSEPTPITMFLSRSAMYQTKQGQQWGTSVEKFFTIEVFHDLSTTQE